jgi:hypothetical protein
VKLAVVAAPWTAALVLGYLGFSAYFRAQGQTRPLLRVFHLSLQLFVLESGAVQHSPGVLLETARLLAPAVALLTVIQLIGSILIERWRRLRLRLRRRHAVVCGLGWQGSELAGDLRRKGLRAVAIEKDRDNPFAGSLDGTSGWRFSAMRLTRTSS